MAIRAWLIERWNQTVQDGTVYNLPASSGLAPAWLDLTNTVALNIPPGVNVVGSRVDNLKDKAALDALDATPGVIVLAAIDQDTGGKVAGYLRPQDPPTGAQLNAAKTRLQAAGIPTGELTARISVGMTLVQISDALRAYAKDLTKAQAQAAKTP